MKYPNLFVMFWPKDQCEPDIPKFGIDWYKCNSSKTRLWDGIHIRLIWPKGIIDMTIVNDGLAYANEFTYKGKPEWGWSLIPIKTKKHK